MSLCFLCKNCVSPAAICYLILEIPGEMVMAGFIAHVNIDDSRLNKWTNIELTNNKQMKPTVQNDLI